MPDPLTPPQVYQMLKGNIERVIQGRDLALRKLLAAFASGGHVLLEDFPGASEM